MLQRLGSKAWGLKVVASASPIADLASAGANGDLVHDAAMTSALHAVTCEAPLNQAVPSSVVIHL